jgi:hypothetical protein
MRCHEKDSNKFTTKGTAGSEAEREGDRGVPVVQQGQGVPSQRWKGGRRRGQGVVPSLVGQGVSGPRMPGRAKAGNRLAPNVVISAITPSPVRSTSSLQARNFESPGRHR